ncbi:hypothetical protein [Flavobacterium sp. PL12]|uniref:hypothetical protein n=1 Tax=Flavobacterium sp. PL12 TaxID=3071718 RepID=UPI00319E39EE
MDKYLYTCHYCAKEYKPNRRHKQRFCSNSCRVNSFNRNIKKNLIVKKDTETEIKKPIKIDAMSWSGVGNAAAGALAVNMVSSLLTKNENKPATKKDLEDLKNSLKVRYQPILNMPFRYDGAKPFYDLKTQNIIYSLTSLV